MGNVFNCYIKFVCNLDFEIMFYFNCVIKVNLGVGCLFELCIYIKYDEIVY